MSDLPKEELTEAFTRKPVTRLRAYARFENPIMNSGEHRKNDGTILVSVTGLHNRGAADTTG